MGGARPGGHPPHIHTRTCTRVLSRLPFLGLIPSSLAHKPSDAINRARLHETRNAQRCMRLRYFWPALHLHFICAALHLRSILLASSFHPVGGHLLSAPAGAQLPHLSPHFWFPSGSMGPPFIANTHLFFDFYSRGRSSPNRRPYSRSCFAHAPSSSGFYRSTTPASKGLSRSTTPASPLSRGLFSYE